MMRAEKQAIVRGTRPTLVACLLMGALVLALAGCGSSRDQVMLTPGAVRAAFAREGFRPGFVFNSRTATVASINRLYPPSADALKREVNAFARRDLEKIVARSSLHPMTIFGFPGMAIYVFGRLIDSPPALVSMRRRAAFGKFPFPRYDVRIANVVVSAGTLSGKNAKRLLAVEADLRSVAAQR